MAKSKKFFKRLQPLIGTFIEVSILNEEDHRTTELNTVITLAFDKAQELEKVFNFHDQNSEISKLNQCLGSNPNDINAHLKTVLDISNQIYEASNKAFNHFLINEITPPKYDLSGIAKGYIVDQIVEVILDHDPNFQGIVNAGGDLRCFNLEEPTIDIRMGSNSEPLLRQISLKKNAIATSSLSVLQDNNRSSSRYSQTLRKNLSVNHTVSVCANECMIADALTKVGLFADVEIIKKCATLFEAQIMIFDAEGTLQEVF